MRIASFYRFLDLDDPPAFRDALQAQCDANGLLGTVLVAEEGFNATLAGRESAIRAVCHWIEDGLSLDPPIAARWTDAAEPPFRRMRVRRKKEIVTLGRPDIRPHKRTGSNVTPEAWNALLEDPDVLVVDVRNQYEIEVGTFACAIDPGTDSFREFPRFAEKLAETAKNRPLAMFCTGGIRCEKASALLLELGFEAVYQLQGGVLQYLKDMPPADNLWEGECFVFDTRVAVDRDLAEGGYVQCHACRRPLSVVDIESPAYREGVSCPFCIEQLDEDRASQLEERRRQVALARERGERHIGPK